MLNMVQKDNIMGLIMNEDYKKANNELFKYYNKSTKDKGVRFINFIVYQLAYVNYKMSNKSIAKTYIEEVMKFYEENESYKTSESGSYKNAIRLLNRIDVTEDKKTKNIGEDVFMVRRFYNDEFTRRILQVLAGVVAIGIMITMAIGGLNRVSIANETQIVYNDIDSFMGV